MYFMEWIETADREFTSERHKKIIKKQKKMIKSVDKVNQRVYNIIIK